MARPQWTELEEALIEGYASPEYAEWYETHSGRSLPEDFNPVERARLAVEDVRRTFESGSRSDWMRRNEFSAAVVKAVFGFKTTKEWREAWMGPSGPSVAQLKRQERLRQEEEGRKAAEEDYRRGRWMQSGKRDPYWSAYTMRMRELHGMSPEY
jgi:hypothetical protein